MKMKIIKVIFIFSLLFSQSTSLAQVLKLVSSNEPLLDSLSIIGRYTCAFPRGFESGTLLILNADKTYLLKEHPDLREYRSQGKWYIEITKYSYGLYLTSDDNTYGIREVIEKKDESDSLKFSVEDIEGSAMVMTPISVESGQCFLDTLGRAVAKFYGIKAFTIKDSFLGDCDYKYEVKNQKANIFQIKVKPKDQYYIYMKDLYWRIGSNFLYCPDNGMLLTKENVKIDSKKAK
jgi:hypothetical protein